MNQSVIEEAIRTKAIIEFYYSSHHRVVEPHVLGIHTGIIQLLGYQIDGSSSSGKLPEWRRFDLNRMSNIQITDKKFSGQRPSGHHSSWDRTILVVDD
ncbi:MAG TPA: WYL domain-containing protein [bacterium]|nr:WYL domain-containing protein [bacterium]